MIQKELNIKLGIRFKIKFANSEKVSTFAATYLPHFSSNKCAQGKFLLYMIMNKEERIDYWLSVAEYDLETAEAMYSTGRWLYVAFMCHQVIEKTMKAYWCATQEDAPPYVHNHKRLAAGCGLYESMSEQQKDFLNTITTYNIEARYPESKDALARKLDKDACRYIIEQTKALQTWIKQQLDVTKQ